MQRFGDFAKEDRPLEGEKRRIDELLNREIIVTGGRIRESKYKDEGRRSYMTLQVEIEEKRFVVFTGSEILINQIEKYRDHIPFIATIVKVDRYYTFS